MTQDSGKPAKAPDPASATSPEKNAARNKPETEPSAPVAEPGNKRTPEQQPAQGTPTTKPVALGWSGIGFALLAVVAWLVMLGVLAYRVDIDEPKWNRLLFLFTSLETVAFAAFGAVLGTVVQRQRVTEVSEERNRERTRADEAENAVEQESRRAKTSEERAKEAEEAAKDTERKAIEKNKDGMKLAAAVLASAGRGGDFEAARASSNQTIVDLARRVLEID